MREALPREVYDSYERALLCLAAAMRGGGGSASSNAAAPDAEARLPWRGSDGAPSAAAAVAWLGGVLERAEYCKAQLRLDACTRGPAATRLGPTGWVALALARIDGQQQRQGQARQGGSLVEAAETALQRFVLLQLLWFDLRCRSYGDEVRPVCGFWDVGESRSVLRHAVY